ncbi:hypothetical protein M1437_00620 [Patescibacteria group bacterium]|nr:hypothetical protein [Patescibacteria group bacterium]
MNQEMLPHFYTGLLVDAEILDGLEKVGGGYASHPDFEGFSQEFIGRVLTYPLRKTNIALSIGPCAVGKTDAANQWVMRTIPQLTGEFEIDFKHKPLQVKAEKLEIYRIQWTDGIKAALKLGIIPPLKYGEWLPKHLDEVTNLIMRAVNIARKGAKNFPGIDNNSIGIIAIDGPGITATRTEDDIAEGRPYRGLNRLYTLVCQLMQDPLIQPNVSILSTITDAASQRRRLSEREKLPSDANIRTLARWFSKMGLVMERSELKAIAKGYPTSFATTFAATEIARQAGQLMLDLSEQESLSYPQKKEIELTEEEKALLIREQELFNQGANLLSPAVDELQDMKMSLLGRKLYPHILKSAGVRARQSFTASNKDINARGSEVIHTHPGQTVDRNLIDRIWFVNPELLRDAA